MTAGRPQKYMNRASCSISIEGKLKAVAQNMNIDFSKALTQGLQFLIDYRIKSGEKIHPSILEDWKEVKEMALSEIREYLDIEQDRQALLTDTIADKKETEKRLNEKIRVFDEDLEKSMIIRRADYNPAIHRIYAQKQGESE